MWCEVWLVLLLSWMLQAHASNVRCVCSPAECEQLTNDDCPVGSGLVWDPCGCCKLCARLEFEACGGPDGFHGSCAEGLECVVGAPETGTALDRANLEGTCRRVASAAEKDAVSRCGDAARTRHGCDIVETHCRCQERRVCPDDAPPFSFAAREECEINLAAMMVQQQVSEGVGWVSGGCQVAGAGEVVRHGESWWSEDRCTECQCKNGVLECQNSHCASCINPHYLPGHCCPVCHDHDIHMSHCNWVHGCALKCKHGLRRDDEGCFHCDCHRVEGEGCPLQCPGDRYAVDAVGETLCQCANQSTPALPPPTQPEPRATCTDSGVERLDAEEWSDGCRHCTCNNGVVLCSLLACPRCPGASVSLPGECCPRCNGSASEEAGIGSSACQSEDGAVRQLGARWRLEAACAWCECRRGGQVLCGAEACPPAACSNPVAVSGECCPRCMSLPHRPTVHDTARPCPATRVEGESWRKDACTSCLCIKKQAVCFEETCQPPACAFPLVVKGRCCPTCQNATETSAVCVSGNSTYSLGDTWWRSTCVQCVCRDNGRIVCSPPPKCRPAQCEHPVQQPDQCCPTCLSETKSWEVYHTTAVIIGTLVVVLACACWCTSRMSPYCHASAAKVRSCTSGNTYAAFNPIKPCDSERDCVPPARV